MNRKRKPANTGKAPGTLEVGSVEYLSVAQAGALTSTSVWFWRRQAYQGVVSSVKLGKRLLIPRAEVERMVAENTRPRVQSSLDRGVEQGEAGQQELAEAADRL